MTHWICNCGNISLQGLIVGSVLVASYAIEVDAEGLPGLRAALDPAVESGEIVHIEGPPSLERDGDRDENSAEWAEANIGPRRALGDGVYANARKNWPTTDSSDDMSTVVARVRRRYNEIVLSHVKPVQPTRIDVEPQTWVYPSGYDHNPEPVTVHARRLVLYAVDHAGDTRHLVIYFVNYDRVDRQKPQVCFQINGHFGQNPSRVGLGLEKRGGLTGGALGKLAVQGLSLIVYDDHDVGESSPATGTENGLHRTLANLRMIDEALLTHFDRVDALGLSGGTERLYHFLVFHRCKLRSAYLSGLFDSPWTNLDRRDNTGGPFGTNADTYNELFASNFGWADLVLVGIDRDVRIAFAHQTYEGGIGKNCFFKEMLPTLRRFTDKFEIRGDDPDGDGISNNGRNLSHEYDLLDYREFVKNCQRIEK